MKLYSKGVIILLIVSLFAAGDSFAGDKFSLLKPVVQHNDEECPCPDASGGHDDDCE